MKPVLWVLKPWFEVRKTILWVLKPHLWVEKRFFKVMMRRFGQGKHFSRQGNDFLTLFQGFLGFDFGGKGLIPGDPRQGNDFTGFKNVCTTFTDLAPARIYSDADCQMGQRMGKSLSSPKTDGFSCRV
jgi:hypothetical protein